MVAPAGAGGNVNQAGLSTPVTLDRATPVVSVEAKNPMGWSTVLVLAWSSFSTVQQGGVQGTYQRSSLQLLDNALGTYMNGEEQKSLLTPGEFVEWKLNLKAGEAVVADARSDAFDPGLEVVDAQGKVFANNDDRYPGDQRPLLFWRCPKEGAYSLRARSFQNRAGGQVFVRFRTYPTMDVPGEEMVEGTFNATEPFMVRVPMKGGQIKQMVAERRGEGNYLTFRFDTVIYPGGLPEHSPSLSERLQPAIDAIVAPLDGDYYVLVNPYGYVGGAGRVRIGARTLTPLKPGSQGGAWTASAPNDRPALLEFPVKKGDILEASVADLNIDCRLTLAAAPDFSKYSVAKAETNPFFPLPRNQAPEPEAITQLPARARDQRMLVFRAERDATLWLSTDGSGPDGKNFAFRVRPAAADFAEDKTSGGKLRIANHDYWAFDANAGDVMAFTSSTAGFNQVTVVRDPDLVEVRHVDAGPDQTADAWRMVVQKPGRYLLSMGCFGDGGGGDYTLTRKVYRPVEFSKASPAKGEINEGEIQIWKFTAKPGEPLLVRWTASAWSTDVAIYDDKGQPTDFQRQDIDANTRLGILKVDQPRTFVIVLTGRGAKTSYQIGLTDVPKG